MMMILNLHFAIFLGSSWQIVGGLETPYITCCSLVVPATLKDHPVRWEKDEGQWRSYPLNDSIELDRYWQAFQAQAAGNEAKCSVLGSFFFWIIWMVRYKKAYVTNVQSMSQDKLLKSQQASCHSQPWGPRLLWQKPSWSCWKTMSFGTSVFDNKTQFSGCVMDHIFGAHELFVCPFAKDKLDLNILRQSLCFWSDQIIMIRFIFVRQKQLHIYDLCIYI